MLKRGRRAIALRLTQGGKSGHQMAPCRVKNAGTPSESEESRTVSQKTNRLEKRKQHEVRVKWRGKSSPPEAQATGHDKPHGVQDRTGNGSPARFAPAKHSRVLVASRRVPQNKAGVLHRQDETNDRRSVGTLRPRVHRIRLTVVPNWRRFLDRRRRLRHLSTLAHQRQIA